MLTLVMTVDSCAKVPSTPTDFVVDLSSLWSGLNISLSVTNSDEQQTAQEP